MDESWGRPASALSRSSAQASPMALRGRARPQHSSNTQRILRQLESLSSPAAAARSMNLGRAPTGLGRSLASARPSPQPSRLRGPPVTSLSGHSSRLASAAPYQHHWRSSEASSRSSTPSSQLHISTYPPPATSQPSTSRDASAGGKMGRKAGASTFSAHGLDSQPAFDLAQPPQLNFPGFGGSQQPSPALPGFACGLTNGAANLWGETNGEKLQFRAPVNLSRGPRRKVAEVQLEESPVKKEPMSEESSPNSASSSSASASTGMDGVEETDGPWKCRHCHYRNQDDSTACFLCSRPKAAAAKAPVPAFALKKELKTEKEDEPVPAEKKSAAAKWSCGDCFVSNDPTADKCACCGAASPKATPKAEAPAAKPWNCADCFVSNKAEVDKCVCCGGAGPNASKAPAAAAKPWNCGDCFVANKADAAKCVCCGGAGPAGAASGAKEAAAPSKDLSSKGLKLNASSAFSFGFGGGSAAKPSQGGTDPPDPQPATKSAPTAKGMSFDLSKPAESATNLFGFKKPSETKPVEGGKPWSCTTCFVSNDGTATCVACQSPRPGTSFKPISFRAPAADPASTATQAKKSVTFNDGALTETKIITPNLTPQSGFGFSPASTAPASAPLAFPSVSSTTTSLPTSSASPFSAPTSTTSSTSSSSGLLFPPPTSSTAPKPSDPPLFGSSSKTSLAPATSTTSTNGPVSSLFGLSKDPVPAASVSTSATFKLSGKRVLDTSGETPAEKPPPLIVPEAQAEDKDAPGPAKKAFGGFSFGTSGAKEDGKPAAAATVPPLLFGDAAKKSDGPAKNLFGAPAASTAAPSLGLFGATPASTSAAPTAGIFGAPADKPAAAPSLGPGLFGAAKTDSAAAASGLFGAKSDAGAPLVFGAKPDAAAPAPLSFGAPRPAGSASGLFGGAGKAEGGSGLFGPPADTSTPLFGSKSAATPLFGLGGDKASDAAAPLFGPTASTPSFGNGGLSLGTAAPAPAPAPTTGFNFGAAAGAPPSFQFGAGAGPAAGTITFGGSPAPGASPLPTAPPPNRKIVRANRRIKRN